MIDCEFIELLMSDGVAMVTMNRPPFNVLHIPMMREFNAVLETVLADTSVAAVVIGATGKAFSAGVDVSDHTAEKMDEMLGQFHGICRQLISTDVLTIAAVSRAALGGGCELACCCDIILASDRAKFGQPEVQVGVFPPVAACVLPYQIGLKNAIELTTIGATIEADRALRIGLVNHVYPADEFESSVTQYLAAIRSRSRPVMRLAKRATVMASRDQILAQLERVEKLYAGELMKLADAHEGIEAFVEKRAPVWKHRSEPPSRGL